MANIIDGRVVSQATRIKIREQVSTFTKNTGVVPALAVILVGEDPASAVYVRNKHNSKKY